jgi:hypothetical protein
MIETRKIRGGGWEAGEGDGVQGEGGRTGGANASVGNTTTVWIS